VNCYTPRTSFRSGMVGGLFVLADGSRRAVPDQWMSQVEITGRATLIRIGYTFCTIEVSGQSLDQIFDDAAAGRLGVVVAGGGDAPATGLWVSSIVFAPPDAPPFPDSEPGCSDA